MKAENFHIQQINEVEEYLIGKYDIELLTLPRHKFYNIEVSSIKTTKYVNRIYDQIYKSNTLFVNSDGMMRITPGSHLVKRALS